MAGYLYWRRAPEWPRSGAADKLPEYLAPVLRGASWSIAPVNTGPAGGGHLLVPSPHKGVEPTIGYWADRQTWRQLSHEVWCGWETANPPRPEDLLRKGGLDGEPIELAGAPWVVPVVHASPWSAVPNQFVVGVDGEISLQPAPGYEALVAEAAYWWEFAQVGGPWDKVRLFRFAAALLGINYQVGPWHVSSAALNLVSDQPAVMVRIVLAALGTGALKAEIEAQKKRDIAGGGGADSAGAGG